MHSAIAPRRAAPLIAACGLVAIAFAAAPMAERGWSSAAASKGDGAAQVLRLAARLLGADSDAATGGARDHGAASSLAGVR